MDQRLKDVLTGKEANYIFPLFWQKGGYRERLVEQIEEIYASNVRAFCVESRPHPDFCGDSWWADMDIILSQAKKRGMRVWIMDDDHFPTGHANGWIANKYPHLRKWNLIEYHTDVMGPMNGASVLLRKASDEDILLGAYACRYAENGKLSGEVQNLSACVQGRFLYWDIPKGAYRVFFLYRSRAGVDDRIDMLQKDSVRVLIDAVYEPHYARYADEFGRTIAGFFSDEPSFGNGFFDATPVDYGMYERTVGMPGLSLPWSDEVPLRMEQELGYSVMALLPSLWFDLPCAPEVRLAYMNAVTQLYSECFTQQIGAWCRSHHVQYVGHVIEDMNAHARLGCGAGHYFRSMKGQDMSGMNIVLHQILPGFAHTPHAAPIGGGEAEPEFFHYALAKLCASDAHLDPAKHSRAMCELFGAYGWGEGTPVMKWLVDHLLVRGVNHFVPHAFSPGFPNPDCPPHFGSGGRDPQFEGFSILMQYINRASHLLSGGIHHADAAILYHAEGEWMNRDQYMKSQVPAKALYDAHIDFDFVPVDMLSNAAVRDGKLVVGAESYHCLILPYAKYLPDTAGKRLLSLQSQGACILFAEGLPDNAQIAAPVLPVARLAGYLRERGMAEVSVDGNYPLLRHYHISRGETEFFLFFNESVTEHVHTHVELPVSGSYLRIDLLANDFVSGTAGNGCLEIDLPPYASVLYCFGDLEDEAFRFPPAPQQQACWELSPTYQLSLAESGNCNDFRPFDTVRSLYNVTAAEHMPGFSGKMRYEATFQLPDSKQDDIWQLDLGAVGQCAHVWVNGVDCSVRIAPPYRFSIGSAVRPEENSLRIEVSNTLVQTIMDGFSTYLQLPPSGLLGPVTLLRFSREKM